MGGGNVFFPGACGQQSCSATNMQHEADVRRAHDEQMQQRSGRRERRSHAASNERTIEPTHEPAQPPRRAATNGATNGTLAIARKSYLSYSPSVCASLIFCWSVFCLFCSVKVYIRQQAHERERKSQQRCSSVRPHWAGMGAQNTMGAETSMVRLLTPLYDAFSCLHQDQHLSCLHPSSVIRNSV